MLIYFTLFYYISNFILTYYSIICTFFKLFIKKIIILKKKNVNLHKTKKIILGTSQNMNLQLKTKNHYFISLHQFCIEKIAYIILFLIPLVTVAQSTTTTIYVSNEATIYINNEAIIYGINQIHSEKISVKQIHNEPLYITKETPFHVDSSLVATISFIDKKKEHSKKPVFKTIPTENRATSKAIVQQQYQFKYQKNTIPFKAEQLFKNGIIIVVSASNAANDLKDKNSVLSFQKSLNRIQLTHIVEVKKTTYTTLFQITTILKEGIVTYKRPPPFLFV